MSTGLPLFRMATELCVEAKCLSNKSAKMEREKHVRNQTLAAFKDCLAETDIEKNAAIPLVSCTNR